MEPTSPTKCGRRLLKGSKIRSRVPSITCGRRDIPTISLERIPVRHSLDDRLNQLKLPVDADNSFRISSFRTGAGFASLMTMNPTTISLGVLLILGSSLFAESIDFYIGSTASGEKGGIQ